MEIRKKYDVKNREFEFSLNRKFFNLIFYTCINFLTCEYYLKLYIYNLYSTFTYVINEKNLFNEVIWSSYTVKKTLLRKKVLK